MGIRKEAGTAAKLIALPSDDEGDRELEETVEVAQRVIEEQVRYRKRLTS